jgi:hypothetical protein
MVRRMATVTISASEAPMAAPVSVLIFAVA